MRTELGFLSLCVMQLKDNVTIQKYPEIMRQSLRSVLESCRLVVERMQDHLKKVASESFGRRLQWAIKGKGEMDRLRQTLEAHKSSLSITLEMSSKYPTQDPAPIIS